MVIMMKSLMAGVSLLAFASVATAGEPVTLTDTQMDGVTAGLGVTFNSEVNLTKTINKTITLFKTVDILQAVNLTGVVADAEAVGDVRFPNANDGVNVETFAEVQIEIGVNGLNSAEAFSQALAAYVPAVVNGGGGG
jgi:hypothetical protein